MPTYHDYPDFFGDDRLYPGVGDAGVVNAALHAHFWGQALDEAVHLADAAGRLDLLQGTAETASRTDTGSGVALSGGVVVSARRLARPCRLVPGPSAPYEDAGSLRVATALDPVCVVDRGTARVLPAHATGAVLQTLGPFTGRIPYDPETEQTDLPDLHPLIASLAEAGVRVRYAAAYLDATARFLADELEDGPAALAREDEVTVPALDLAGMPALPAAPAPVWASPPALPATPSVPTEYAFTAFDAATADEDPELALAELQKVRAGLERYAAEMRNLVERHQADVQRYVAENQEETAEVQAYLALVQARAAAFDTLVSTYLAEHVQAKLARYVATEAAHVAAYRAGTEAGADRRAALQARVEALSGALARLRQEYAVRATLVAPAAGGTLARTNREEVAAA